MDELDNFQSFLKYLGIFSVICSKMYGPRDYRTKSSKSLLLSRFSRVQLYATP